jgi:hypothetical protein
MADGWEKAVAAPATTDFWKWLESQYNGLKPGQAAPAALARPDAAPEAPALGSPIEATVEATVEEASASPSAGEPARKRKRRRAEKPSS